MHYDFSYFVWELRNEGFTKLTNQIRLVRFCYFRTQISQVPDKISKKLVSRLCSVNMRIISAKFQPSSFKTIGGDRGDRRMDGWMDGQTDRHFYQPKPY